MLSGAFKICWSHVTEIGVRSVRSLMCHIEEAAGDDWKLPETRDDSEEPDDYNPGSGCQHQYGVLWTLTVTLSTASCQANSFRLIFRIKSGIFTSICVLRSYKYVLVRVMRRIQEYFWFGKRLSQCLILSFTRLNFVVLLMYILNQR